MNGIQHSFLIYNLDTFVSGFDVLVNGNGGT